MKKKEKKRYFQNSDIFGFGYRFIKNDLLIVIFTFILSKLEFGFYNSHIMDYLHRLKKLSQINITE